MFKLRFAPQLPADFHAVHFGHHDIEDDQAGLDLFGSLDAIFSIGCGKDFKSFLYQIIPDKIKYIWFIIYNENFDRVHLCEDWLKKGL